MREPWSANKRKEVKMDKELFELCKEVYEQTSWKAGDWFYERTDPRSRVPLKTLGRPDVGFHLDNFDRLCPLYTSDYLLEKLPKGIRGDYLNIFSAGTTSWYALYGRTTTAKETGLYGESDTPLKALLKLTIALHEAGELK